MNFLFKVVPSSLLMLSLCLWAITFGSTQYPFPGIEHVSGSIPDKNIVYPYRAYIQGTVINVPVRIYKGMLDKQWEKIFYFSFKDWEKAIKEYQHPKEENDGGQKNRKIARKD